MIHVYTDGSCEGNPGPGGWAALVVSSEATRRPQGARQGTERLSGGAAHTTNNRMEITAAIKGIEATPMGAEVTVHSDSEYVVKTMTKGWKRKANTDLWSMLDSLVPKRKLSWQWVRGHNGDPLNEEADRLARTAAAMQAAADEARLSMAGTGRDSCGRQAAPPAHAVPDAPKLAARAPAATTSQPGLAPSPVAAPAALTHVDAHGHARMVDVGAKPDTDRVAVATGVVTMRPETLARVVEGRVEKGDVFTVARLAGIAAAKRTWDLIPLAHHVPLSHVGVDFAPDSERGRVTITATARTTAKTGVEMEALAAVSLAALTIYDMCKAVDRAMTIGEVRLLEKHGGTHGDYVASPTS